MQGAKVQKIYGKMYKISFFGQFRLPKSLKSTTKNLNLLTWLELRYYQKSVLIEVIFQHIIVSYRYRPYYFERINLDPSLKKNSNIYYLISRQPKIMLISLVSISFYIL